MKWDEERTIRSGRNYQGNLEMVKYCVEQRCPIETSMGVCRSCQKTVISRYSNTYAKKAKHLGCDYCRLLGLRFPKWSSPHTEIPFVERVSMVNLTKDACKKRKQPRTARLDGLKYLCTKPPKRLGTRTAVREAHENSADTPSVYNTSSTTDCPLPPDWRYEHGELHTS